MRITQNCLLFAGEQQITKRINIYLACVWLPILLLSQLALAGEAVMLPQGGNLQAMVRVHETSPETLALEDAVTLALSDNLRLAAMQARARALAEVPSQVGTLPDPTISLNALNVPTDTFSLSQEAMTQTQIGIGLMLPFPNKLGLREQVANFEAEAAEHDVAERHLMLVRSVRSSWWNLFYLDHALFLIQRNRALLREFVKIAESKYKTGQGMQSDVLLAQVELSKLLDTEIALQASRRSQAAILNALLGRDAVREIRLPAHDAERLPAAPDVKTLTLFAQENRPLLNAFRKTVEAARSRVNLAGKAYYPDFKLGVAYGFRDGNNPDGSARADLANLSLSMNLPIFSGSRQDKAVAQRRAEMQKNEYELQDAQINVMAEIEQAIAEYQAALEQASLFKTGIIPQANQTASAMLSAYQVSRVDFLNLVRAQVTLYNYETQYWKTISAAWQAWARLEGAVGKQIATSEPVTDKEKTQ